MSKLFAVLDRVQHTVMKTSELFYQQKEQEAYISLNEAITSIIEVTELLYEYEQKTGEAMGIPAINQILNEALAAMQQKDTVLLADIFQYDLLERFNETRKKIEKS